MPCCSEYVCCSLVVVGLSILYAEAEGVRQPSLERVSVISPSVVEEAVSPNQRQSKPRHIQKGFSLKILSRVKFRRGMMI